MAPILLNVKRPIASSHRPIPASQLTGIARGWRTEGLPAACSNQTRKCLLGMKSHLSSAFFIQL